QDNYMWYLRDYLVLPDVRLAKLQQNAEARSSRVKEKAAKREKKGLKGFFRNLFKKREPAPDSTATPLPIEDFDFIDTDTLSQASPPRNEVQARNGFFGPANQPGTRPGLSPANDPNKPKTD